MAGNRRSEDAGEVPWPALVDLLTSVLIAFMFFILITTVAMSTMTMKMAEDISEKREQAQKTSETQVVSGTDAALSAAEGSLLSPPAAVTAHTVESEDPISEQENQRLKAENELLKQQLAAMGSSFAKSKEIQVVEDKAAQALTLLFNPNEAGTTPEVEAALAVFVKNLTAARRVELTASEPNGVSFSQARERALTRAMVVRNKLLEQGLDASRISFVYSSEARLKSRNWVRVQAVEAGRGAGAR